MNKSHTAYFTFHTKKKRELVHLTPRPEEVLDKTASKRASCSSARLIVKVLGF
jgi:hypothetical protein